MNNLKVNQRVVKNSRTNEYLKGTIIKIKGNKALVYFESKFLSRWCNLTNIQEIVKC